MILACAVRFRAERNCASEGAEANLLYPGISHARRRAGACTTLFTRIGRQELIFLKVKLSLKEPTNGHPGTTGDAIDVSLSRGPARAATPRPAPGARARARGVIDVAPAVIAHMSVVSKRIGGVVTP